MATTRREFIKQTATGTVALGAGSLFPGIAALAGQDAKAAKKLRLLILGGTGFLGPHTVRAALARGHEMTLFNRGKTNPHLFPELEKLKGDRKDNLKALENRKWDAVIDTSGYVPRLVKMSADLLAGGVKQYIFISSISVFNDFTKVGIDESDPVGTMEDETVEEITGETYGPLKALCEQAAEKALPKRVANIRPGLIVGPDDRSDRFTYWPVRIDRGGEVLAPGTPGDAIQFIDVRDLGEWIIHCIERNIVGVFNATSPAGERNMGGLLEACKRESKSDARLTWADHEFLEAQKVAPWTDMPVWLPPVDEYKGFGMVSTKKAYANGLKHRPMAETIRDTLKWFKSQSAERQEKIRSGIKPDREKEVLKAWHEKQKAGGQ
jgi:2'-hydroxyisoflavone reductase